MTTIPVTGGSGDDETPQTPDVRHMNPFRDTALDYRKSGWCGVLPLPYKKKNPPPLNFTGHKAKYPDLDQIKAWFELGQKNIGLRLAGVDDDHEIIGIDVDHYTKGAKEKFGGDQLKVLEAKLGALPDTWISSSRTDGVSGIRYLRVPRGLMFKGQVAQDIECISKGYRFAAVWPSAHPDGGIYWWFPPGVKPDAKGRKAWRAHQLPTATDLPLLPDKWLEHLKKGNHADLGDRMDSDSSADEIWQWCDETLHGDDDTAPCQTMREKVARQIADIKAEATSHDKIVKAHFNLAMLAFEGHLGYSQAISEVESAWASEVVNRDKRGLAELQDEIFRSRINAFRKVKAASDDRVKIGATPVDTRCDESGVCKPATAADDRPATVCLADVAPTAVRWLWKGWLPLGKVSILEGESDVGKSTVTLAWASIVSNGRSWPETVINGKTLTSQHNPADVVLVGIEDSNDDTVVPRLIAVGADLKRVHALNRPVDDNGDPKPFTIPDDIGWLRKAIVEAGAKLVIIDPITACLPEDTKHGIDGSIRRILMHLVDLARDTDSAIVLIRHFNKAAGMSAKNRGGGSVAYSALVRSVLSVAKLKENQDNGSVFAIARAIGNLSKVPESIGYQLNDAPHLSALPKAEDDELRVSVVKWCGTVNINADQLVGADGAKVSDARKTAPVRDDAEAALKELLAGGAMKMNEALTEAMKIAACSKQTVKLAAKNLEVIKKSVYVDGKISYWTWELPPTVFKMKPSKQSHD